MHCKRKVNELRLPWVSTTLWGFNIVPGLERGKVLNTSLMTKLKSLRSSPLDPRKRKFKFSSIFSTFFSHVFSKHNSLKWIKVFRSSWHSRIGNSFLVQSSLFQKKEDLFAFTVTPIISPKNVSQKYEFFFATDKNQTKKTKNRQKKRTVWDVLNLAHLNLLFTFRKSALTDFIISLQAETSSFSLFDLEVKQIFRDRVKRKTLREDTPTQMRIKVRRWWSNYGNDHNKFSSRLLWTHFPLNSFPFVFIPQTIP